MRKRGKSLWKSHHLFDLTTKWLLLVTVTKMMCSHVISFTDTYILHEDLPSAKPSLVHCTCPAWLVTSHSNMASPPSCTLTSFGWIRKYCCWPDTVTTENISVTRAELTVFNKSKIAFQFCAVYFQSNKRARTSVFPIYVLARVRITFRAVRLQ